MKVKYCSTTNNSYWFEISFSSEQNIRVKVPSLSDGKLDQSMAPMFEGMMGQRAGK